MDPVNKRSDIVRDARTRLGYTQQQLADAVGFSRNYIAKIEAGMKEPSLRLVMIVERLVAQMDPEYRNLEDRLHEEYSPVLVPPEQRIKRDALLLASALNSRWNALLEKANRDPDRLAWIYGQMQLHLNVPDAWNKTGDSERSEDRLARKIRNARARAAADLVHETNKLKITHDHQEGAAS